MQRVQDQLIQIQTEKDTIKSENDKIRVLIKQKMRELNELKAKYEADTKSLQE